MNTDLRIYYSKTAFPLYEKYCAPKGNLFPQKSDMFFWCVVLGYNNSPDFVPPNITANQRKGEIHYGAFDDDIQKPFLKMIAVEANQDFKILNQETDEKGHQKFRDVVQSYAELGFTILNTQMSGEYTADKLMGLLIDNAKL